MPIKTVPLSDPSILRRIPKDLRDVVKAAGEVGWSGRTMGDGGLRLFSPDGETMVSVPNVVGDIHTVANISRKILRATPLDKQRDFAERTSDYVAHGQSDKPRPRLVVIEESPAPVPVPVPPLVPAEPTIAREERWRVGSRGHRKVESEHVIERVWSDGRVEYLCAHCGQKRDTPFNVTRHAVRHGRPNWGKGKVAEAVTPAEPEVVEPSAPAEPEPVSSVQAAAPQADAAILDEIRRLVLPGQIAAYEQALADKDAQIAAMTAERDEWKKKAAHIQDTLTTLVGLAQDAAKDVQ